VAGPRFGVKYIHLLWSGKIVRWIELSTRADARSMGTVTSILGRFGQGGAVISEIPGTELAVVKIYLPAGRTYPRLRKEIEQALIDASLAVSLDERILSTEDWLAPLKDDFHITEIGRRLLVRPTWMSDPPSSRRISIQLDPGAAFGTGAHPTTRLCLLNLEKYSRPGRAVLDLGTGTGVLAIAAAKLGAVSVLGLDTDPVAVKTARGNAVLNAVSSAVLIKRGTLSRSFQSQHRGEFDLAVSNITAQAISDLAGGFAKILKRGGILIVSGIHTQGLDQVLVSLALVDFKLESIQRDGEWHAVVARLIS
jgi:ribosomal protein L11 methyltransferase